MKDEKPEGQSDEMFRIVFDHAPIGNCLVSLDGRFLSVNSAFCRMLGYSESELLSMTFREVTHPDDKQSTLDEMARQLQKGFSINFENRYICKDGSLRWLSWRAIFNKDEGITYATGRDITECKIVEEALQESEERFRILLDQGFDGIFIHENLIILDLNQRMADISGYSPSELLQSDVINLFTPDSQSRIHDYIRSGKGGYYEVELQRKDGRIVQIEAFGAPCKFHGRDARIVAIRDITEQKRLQEQLRQAQKMEAIGLLAGGVAHDFNNILSAIVGYAHLALMKMKDDDPLRKNLDQILASSERAATLTRSLLAFSRKQIIIPKPVDVNGIVFGMKMILGRIIGEDIEVKVNTAVKDLIAKADKGQIEQVLMNLATNARDAMPHGGTLTITTEEIEIDERFIQMHQYGEVGRYAVISVADTGVGMDKKTKQNIFEPFFTTKEVGKGTGLGLAMVYGTVIQHGGFIDVCSEPGQGTTFMIYLPLAESCVQRKGKKEAPCLSSGKETVLLVEDDKAVREATKALLEVFGYTVIEAIDGKSAVKLFRENKDLVQLVISDVIMPGQSGKGVYNELKKIKSDIRVLFISGYSADILTKKGVMREGGNFISKPISPDTFLKKVRELLDK